MAAVWGPWHAERQGLSWLGGFGGFENGCSCFGGSQRSGCLMLGCEIAPVCMLMSQPWVWCLAVFSLAHPLG